MRTDLEVRSEWVWESEVAREGGQDEVPHLNAVGRNYVAEHEVVVAQELREVVQQHQQHAEGA